MPEFGNPFSGMNSERKLNEGELIRAIRFMVSAEYEAVQLYEQLAGSTDNTLAKNVLIDIADEEKVHAGEFLRLLHELDPKEEEFYRQGAQEVEEEFLGAAPSNKTDAEVTKSGGSPITDGLGIGSLKK